MCGWLFYVVVAMVTIVVVVDRSYGSAATLFHVWNICSIKESASLKTIGKKEVSTSDSRCYMIEYGG